MAEPPTGTPPAAQGPIRLVFVEANRAQATGPRGDSLATEVYRSAELSNALVTTLNTAIRTIAKEKLTNQEYDKTKTHKRERTLKLPAPTLRNPLRTKEHSFQGLTEEYQIQAHVEGEPDIQVRRLPYLRPYGKTGEGLLLFQVWATVPIEGHVRYKIPDLLSASTGYHTVADIAVIGQVRLTQSGSQVTIAPAEILWLDLNLTGLKLSNDILNAARKPIEEIINHELDDNAARVRQEANQAIQKAMKSQEFHNPLLKYLLFLS